MTKVYVLVAKWSDNSDFKVIRVFADKDRADEALEISLACEPGMRPLILEVPYVKGLYE